MTDMIDNRPLASPNRYCFIPLDKAGTAQEAWHELGWAEGDADEVRVTIVSPEHPKLGYPEGWYFEGWDIAPHRMDPPHKAAPFDYPLALENHHDR